MLGTSKGLNESSQNEEIICTRNCVVLQRFGIALSYSPLEKASYKKSLRSDEKIQLRTFWGTTSWVRFLGDQWSNEGEVTGLLERFLV